MILLIDYREKTFIDKLKNKGVISLLDEKNEIYSLQINDLIINYKITNLDIGDFLICNSEIDIYENLILLIERKTFNDLSSSIIDGRFREQKTRIEQTLNDADKIMYILEGSRKEKEKFGVKNNILDGAILNLIFKHKFKLLNTNNVDDTLDTILTIFKKYKKQEFINTNNNSNDNQTITVPEIKLSNLKKSDRILNNIFNLQLCVIPGVSIAISKKITENYKSMNDLIKEYNKISEEDIIKKECLLADIPITDKRKLGKALSKKIYNVLTN